jgi:ribosomal protein S18 acetylase RimI-like enzyme
MVGTVDELRFPAAGPGDADAIAALHADSWRRHYRGAFSDEFLDGDVAAVLRDRWRERFAAQDPRTRTILARRDGELAGFAHTELGAHPEWGALLDNLHVAYGLKRQGVGRRLVALTARAVIDAAPGSGLHLWVLEQNAAARAFYAALGGETTERHAVGAPGGVSSRLNGSPMSLAIVWPDPSRLLAGDSTAAAGAGSLADRKFSD